MNSKILDILAKRHNEWLNMAKSFKLDTNDANELVQDMYIRMYDYTKDVKSCLKKEVIKRVLVESEEVIVKEIIC